MERGIYRPRQPQTTPLYLLLESLYDKVKGVWDDRFARVYGFWRGFTDAAVARYLDCGIPESGFARVRCERCAAEFLLTFSCKGRGLCPSCGAKRAAAFAAFLKDEVLEEVGHAQWVFTIPKMLRPYFLHHRDLLGELCRAAYDTVRELMVAAVDNKDFRPGMVAVIQTFGDSLKWNPHIHALCSRGGWNAAGEWFPLPYIDARAAEHLFRHKVFRLLQKQGLLSDERMALLSSWRHSGFSVDNSVTLYPRDAVGLERLGRYILRSPVSLERMDYSLDTEQVVYHSKPGHDREAPERLEPMEFIARLLTHIPDPHRHEIRYYGYYSSVARAEPQTADPSPDSTETCSAFPTLEESAVAAARIAALRRRWADLIRRVYEIDPLVCARCGGPMRVVSFITQPSVIRRILDHLRRQEAETRGPPRPQSTPVPYPCRA